MTFVSPTLTRFPAATRRLATFPLLAVAAAMGTAAAPTLAEDYLITISGPYRSFMNG